MSGYNRNVMPAERIPNVPGRYLPDILPEQSNYSPRSSRTGYMGSSKYNRTSSSTLNEKKRSLNSTASSATSRRFQDLFYKSGWPSLSDTDSPGCLEIDSSGSSASSMFSWADPDATSLVAEEWEKIQRTLYDEPGSKVLQLHLIDECNQWKNLYPHFRIVGKRCTLKNVESDEFHDTEEEILATQYDSDADSTLTLKAENLSTLKQRQNKKLVKQKVNLKLHDNPNSNRTVKSRQNAIDLIEELDQYLHITSINSTSTYTKSPRAVGTSSIIRSEISSSRWRHKSSSPDFASLPYNSKLSHYQHSSVHIRDNSATSLSSLLSKPSFIKNDISAMKNFDSKAKKSARSIQNTSDKRVHETNSVSKVYPYRSISIPQDFSMPKHGTSKGRNVHLPPLETNQFKIRSDDQYLSYKNVSGRGRSNTRNKNLSPIYSNNHSNGELIVREHNTKSVSSFDVKKSKRKRKKLSKINP